MSAITINEINKTYLLKDKTGVKALEDISFDVKKGELFGLIGPDGAGKTTLIRILTTLILADTGAAFVDGFDVVKQYKDIRKRVGYMPGRFSLYQDMSVEENLQFFSSIFNTSIEENYSLIKNIYEQIAPFKDRRAGKLSGGMKQKLALSCALIHRPSVLFLDEPTTGVDAVSRKEFWDMLKNLKEEGITILVSTPYMDEAGLCDRVALMQHGKILSIDTPELIKKKFGKLLWAVKANEMYPLLLALNAHPQIEKCYPFGEYHHVVFKSNNAGIAELNQICSTYSSVEVKAVEPDIEDCFIALMNEPLTEAHA